MPKTTKPEPIAESTPLLPQVDLPPSVQKTVDEVAWKVIEEMFPVWVKERVAFLLQSDDPKHTATRQIIYSNLRGAIFANVLAGAGLSSTPNVLPEGGKQA